MSEDSVQMLRQKIYPSLNVALLELIDHIVKTEEVRKHQERLKKQKMIDEIEKRRVERVREKEELGSDYYESDEEIDYEFLGIQKERLDSIIDKRMKRAEDGTISQAKEKLFEGVFNPIAFIVQSLKRVGKEGLPA
jgi:hypothetical protein